jgi:DNA-binding NarL/FixJ family response regulator
VTLNSVKTILVDDDAFTRVVLTTAIQALGHDVLGSYESAGEAARAVQVNRPQLAILDLDLGPGPTGIDLAHHLRKQDRTIGIVLLTSYEDPRLIRAKNLTLPEGSVYLSKKQVKSNDVLQMSIETAMAYERLENSIMRPSRKVSDSREARLSDPQVEVMRLIASGITNAEIAKIRFISEAAVGKAISRLVRQLGISASADQNQRVLIARAYFEAIGKASRIHG